ncbi:MAG: NfeD family protein [Legionella sp.]
MHIHWFVLALTVLALEVVTGTFYFLIIAIAAAIVGLANYFDLLFPVQLMLFAISSLIGVILLQYWQRTYRSSEQAQSQCLDIGQPVSILVMHDHLKARVFYRGTEWDAILDVAENDEKAIFYIKEIRGCVLVLTTQDKF